MVERFLLELLIYICFENLRSPLSIYGAIALVCRLWLGIGATLLWFITYCANIVRFGIACTLLMALRAVLATYVAVSVVLGLIGCAIGFACSLLYYTVKLTRVLGDSIAGIALYMCGLAVAYSASALAQSLRQLSFRFHTRRLLSAHGRGFNACQVNVGATRHNNKTINNTAAAARGGPPSSSKDLPAAVAAQRPI